MNLNTCVHNGATMLDTIYPGWDKQIDLEILDMSRANCCVLGQLYGMYDESPRCLRHWKNGFNMKAIPVDAKEYHKAFITVMAILNQLWRELIIARRKERTP
jgi:hypothetical protein